MTHVLHRTVATRPPVAVGGNNLFSLKGLNAGYNWTPQRDRDNVRKFTITLTNMGARATTYTLTAN